MLEQRAFIEQCVHIINTYIYINVNKGVFVCYRRGTFETSAAFVRA